MFCLLFAVFIVFFLYLQCFQHFQNETCIERYWVSSVPAENTILSLNRALWSHVPVCVKKFLSRPTIWISIDTISDNVALSMGHFVWMSWDSTRLKWTFGWHGSQIFVLTYLTVECYVWACKFHSMDDCMRLLYCPLFSAVVAVHWPA